MNVKIENDAFIKLTCDALNQNQTITFKVKGISMWPFYQHQKTSVTLSKKDDYQVFDVVLARYQDRYVLHRILKRKDQTYMLRGDGAILREHISFDDIIGYVYSHENKRNTLESSKWYRLKVFLWVFNPFRRILIRLLRKKS